jgi:tetratricopeptide (TPR) repeat protein
LKYRHLGEDIGYTEAQRKKDALVALIRSVMAKEDTDSPVFVHLAALGLKPMNQADLTTASQAAKSAAETLASILQGARAAADGGRHTEAAKEFRRALELQKATMKDPVAFAPDPFIVQQLAFATYKAEEPNPLDALHAAWDEIQQLSPDQSTDPETLGIAGAIQKRLFERLKQRKYLDKAIELYGRGFDLKRDYYNGENYALCLDLRATALERNSPDDATYDRLTARRVRSRIHDILVAAFEDHTTAERRDYKWMLATMANVLYATGRETEAIDYENRFRRVEPGPSDRELRSFEEGKQYARAIAPTGR